MSRAAVEQARRERVVRRHAATVVEAIENLDRALLLLEERVAGLEGRRWWRFWRRRLS